MPSGCGRPAWRGRAGDGGRVTSDGRGGTGHVRRNPTLRLLAGISVTAGPEKPADRANAAPASRPRRPQRGSRRRRLWSNARPEDRRGGKVRGRPVTTSWTPKLYKKAEKQHTYSMR